MKILLLVLALTAVMYLTGPTMGALAVPLGVVFLMACLEHMGPSKSKPWTEYWGY